MFAEIIDIVDRAIHGEALSAPERALLKGFQGLWQGAVAAAVGVALQLLLQRASGGGASLSLTQVGIIGAVAGANALIAGTVKLFTAHLENRSAAQAQGDAWLLDQGGQAAAAGVAQAAQRLAKAAGVQAPPLPAYGAAGAGSAAPNAAASVPAGFDPGATTLVATPAIVPVTAPVSASAVPATLVTAVAPPVTAAAPGGASGGGQDGGLDPSATLIVPSVEESLAAQQAALEAQLRVEQQRVRQGSAARAQ